VVRYDYDNAATRLPGYLWMDRDDAHFFLLLRGREPSSPDAVGFFLNQF
jgi:hypothetical protein